MHRACALAGLLLVIASARADVVERAIEYDHDGVTMRGTLVYDDDLASPDQPAPGVLLCHEWWGLNDYAKRRGRMLAALGYVAFCLDMYGVDDDGEVRVADTREGAIALVGPVYGDRDLMKARARAGLEVLASQPMADKARLAAIGYCFGGTVALELARSGAPLVATVSFHGNLSTTEPGGARIRGSVLVCHGAADPLGGPTMVDDFIAEMEHAGVDYQLIEYAGAEHAFTNPAADGIEMDGVGYNEPADRRSWRHMRMFFDEMLGETRAQAEGR